MKTLKIYCILLAILFLKISYAQGEYSILSNGLKFKNYTIFDGLPSTSVPSIVQDNKGFMWFGTRDGLSRFDGFNFTNFYRNSEDPLSLSHNQTQCIFLDSKGSMWVGTKNGLNEYIEGVGFKKYFSEADNEKSLSGNLILSIHEDKHGNLWVSTDNGVNLFDKEKEEFIRFKHDANNPNSLQSNFAKEIFFDLKNNLWVLTDIGVDKYDEKNNVFLHYNLENNGINLGELNYAGTIKEDSKGVIWIGDTNGVWYFDEGTNAFKSYFGQNDALKNVAVRSILEDDEGNMLIGTYSGLFIDNRQKNITKHITHSKSDPYSISSNSIHVIYEDREKNIWIGSWAGGINYLDKGYDYFNHYSEASGLSYPVVSSFIEDEKQNLWIGTEGGGLNYFNRQDGTFVCYKHDKDNDNSLAGDNIHDLAKDNEGAIWIATFGFGLDYFNPKVKPYRFKHFKNNPEDKNSIVSNYIVTLLVDSENRLFVGTSNAGVNLYNPDNKSFIRFSEDDYEPSQVTIIYENNQKEILVGTSNGIGVLDLKNKKVLYKPCKTINEVLTENALSIYQDDANNYWIATEGDGLIYANKDFSNIKKYRKNEGLPNDVVYGILPDDKGNLWLSTHNGISKFNCEAKTFENYNVHDGLQSNEFNFDAYAKSSVGEFIIGGVNGFNIFYPSKIKKNNSPSPVILTEFKINEEVVKLDDIKSALSKPINQTKEIVLKHNQSLFSFEFIALNFSQPEEINYKYKLAGLNNDWLDIGSRRQVTFTNIKPGNYVFKVKAYNNDYFESIQETSIKIKVLPPIWKTWFAYVLYFILIASIAFVIWRYVNLRIKDRNDLRQEKIEREKDEEMHELKLRFFTNISHELKTPLTLILGPLDELLNKKNTFSDAIREDISLIHSNAKILLRHVNNIMDFRKDELGQLKLKAAKGNIVKFCQETFISFRQLAESRNIDYKFSNSLELDQMYFDSDKMEMVLFNLLSNAFKYTPDGGKIFFSITPVFSSNNTVEKVQISIKDNGYGMDNKHKAFIFERFFQVETIPNSSSGSGIGLALTKRLVEMHHGHISVTSKLNEGSEFVLELPVGNKHLGEEEIFKAFKNGEDVADYIETNTSDQKQEALDTISTKTNKEELPIILVIEDNYEVRKFIVNCFNIGYNVKEASNGGIGYEMANELIPDIIISDVMMPEMDGISLCSKLKKDTNTSHIPIILLTARTSLIFKKDGLETGADDYINKPFSPSILKLKVKNLIESRKKLHEYFVRNYRVNPKEVILNSKDDEFLEKAIECVEKHLSDSSFNVSVFIEELGMSRSVLFRKIKSLTGQSTTEFIRVIRIKRAAQLLTQKQMSISEIAYEVGFNDLKYFRTCFRRQFKCSPSEFVIDNSKN